MEHCERDPSGKRESPSSMHALQLERDAHWLAGHFGKNEDGIAIVRKHYCAALQLSNRAKLGFQQHVLLVRTPCLLLRRTGDSGRAGVAGPGIAQHQRGERCGAAP